MPDDNKDNESLQKAILEAAANPKRIQSEVGSVEHHSLQELIAADKYLRLQKAADSGHLPIRFIKIRPE